MTNNITTILTIIITTTTTTTTTTTSTTLTGISAVTTDRVKELMSRVRKLVKTIPKQTLEELLISEEDRVNFDRSESSKFTIITDPRFEGQFRVEGDKIERVVNQMNWVSVM